MLLEIGAVTEAQKALNTGKQVCNCTNKEIDTMLKEVFVLIGLRKQHLPSELDGAYIVQFIRSTYALKTTSEFILAFKLAIKDQLNLEPSDVKVYDMFSCDYLARIMTAYRKWLKFHADNKNSIVNLTTPPKALLEDKKEMTQTDWLTWLEDIRNYSFDIIPTLVYDYYKKTKQLKISAKQYEDYLQMAVKYNIYKLDINTYEFTEFVRMKNKGHFTGEYIKGKTEFTSIHMNNVIATAKRLIIWKHILHKNLKDINNPQYPTGHLKKVKQLKKDIENGKAK